jgi:hypothetical protein
MLRREPVYLTAQASQQLTCHDFEGSCILCLPILQPALAAQSIEAEPMLQQRGPRCLGAVLLSTASPAQLDARHARNLQLLAGALALCLQDAAVVLVRHSNLILGVEGQEAEHAWAAQEELSSEAESDLHLTEAEDEDQEQPEVHAEQTQAALQPAWAAGSCRDESPEHPEDPGSAAAALVVQADAARPQSKAAQYAAEAASSAGSHRSLDRGGGMAAPASAATSQGQSHSGEHGKEQRNGQLLEFSKPSAMGEAGEAAESSSTAAAPPVARPLAGDASGSNVGTSQQEELKKPSPAESVASVRELRQAGASWRSLLRFDSPALERRFAHWHSSQLRRSDALSAGLTAALHLLLLARGGMLLAGGPALHLAAAAVCSLALLMVVLAAPTM